MNKEEIIELIKEELNLLYSDRDNWGAGALYKYLQHKDLHIGGEKTFVRAAKILNTPYIELFIGGRKSKSYTKENSLNVFKYIVYTSKKERLEAWYKLYPKDKELHTIKMKLAQEKKKLTLNIKQASDIYISIHKLSKILKYKIGKLGIISLCIKSNINIVNLNKEHNHIINSGKILKSDVPKLLDYIESNYSSDPIIRSRQIAMDTMYERLNNDISQLQLSRLKARKENLEKAKLALEKQLNLKFYYKEEAIAFICKNNSTLISTLKFLNLPQYKVQGTYLYDEESLNIINNFLLNKNGLKGQLARLFEQKIRESNIKFKCEKTYKDLYYKTPKHPLRFDYYFPTYNLLVEVQGIQHFKPSTMGSNISEENMLLNFKETQEKDKLKKQYCINNNINFLEVITKDDFTKFDNLISELKIKKDV